MSSDLFELSDAGCKIVEDSSKVAEKKAKPHYHGHRQRLREKFLTVGGEALPDYELLELLLTVALPRKDVKPLAKDLLAKFGSFGGVISADMNRLTQVKGIKENTASVLKIVQASSVRLLRDKTQKRVLLEVWDDMIDYCVASMAFEDKEKFRVVYLDVKNSVILDELQQEGTVNHTPVYPREVIKKALEVGASSLVMVHNHPSGDVTPSKADIKITKMVAEAARAMGITLYDHVIVSKDKHLSMKRKRFF
jgi:DNA repair protein RadC